MKYEKAILNERNQTHGDYAEVAMVSQDLKHAIKEHSSWGNLTFVQKESLDLICTKISRIVCGNPNVRDHWEDVAGYAKLVAERLLEVVEEDTGVVRDEGGN